MIDSYTIKNIILAAILCGIAVAITCAMGGCSTAQLDQLNSDVIDVINTIDAVADELDERGLTEEADELRSHGETLEDIRTEVRDAVENVLE